MKYSRPWSPASYDVGPTSQSLSFGLPRPGRQGSSSLVVPEAGLNLLDQRLRRLRSARTARRAKVARRSPPRATKPPRAPARDHLANPEVFGVAREGGLPRRACRLRFLQLVAVLEHQSCRSPKHPPQGVPHIFGQSGVLVEACADSPFKLGAGLLEPLPCSLVMADESGDAAQANEWH